MPENLGNTAGRNFTVLRDTGKPPANAASMISTDPGNLLTVGSDGKILYYDPVQVNEPRSCETFPWDVLCSTPSVFPTGMPFQYATWNSTFGLPGGGVLGWEGEELVETIGAGEFMTALEDIALAGGFGYGATGPHPDPFVMGDADEDFCIGLELTTSTVPVYAGSWAYPGKMVEATLYNIIVWIGTDGGWGWDGYSFLPTPYYGCSGVGSDVQMGSVRTLPTSAEGNWCTLTWAMLQPSTPYGIYTFWVPLAEMKISQKFRWSRANWNYTPATQQVLTKEDADPRMGAVSRFVMDMVRYEPFLRAGGDGFRHLTQNVATFRDRNSPGSDMELARSFFADQRTTVAEPEISVEQAKAVLEEGMQKWQF